jgi:hypothetical protein
METQTNWIQDEILDGLSKLLCLGLDRTPASDMIAGTAMMWHAAITDGRVWDEKLDAERFRRAFIVLAQRRRTWPAPADFIEALPARAQLVLTKQPIPANPARAAAALREVEAMLKPRRAQPDAHPVTGKDAAAEQGRAA